MAIRMTYITYTPEAHRAIIEGKQNREPVMRALIEDAGGKFIGFYGLIGRPEGDGVVISDFANLSDYMSVVAKTMLSGAMSDITTAHCYTGEDVVAASTQAAGAVRRMRTRIRLLAQLESMRSIVGATQ